MSFFEELNSLIQDSPTRLVAVSKTKSVSEIMVLYNQGQRIFGENKVQELVEKYEELPKDIQWHLIGHLQSNKVKYIASFIQMIHSVDSLKLLFEINKEAKKSNRIIPILLQMHIASEETKFGLSLKELFEILEYYTAPNSELKNIEIQGLMGMATNTQDEQIIRTEFKELKNTFESVKKTILLSKENFNELSMGMSSDYKIAIQEGSTMIRIGSLLFGSRN